MGRARMPSLAPNVPLIFPTRTSWMLNCKLFSGVCNYHVHHIYLPLSGVCLGTTFPLVVVEGFANCNGAFSCQKLILSTIWEAKTAGLFDLHQKFSKNHFCSQVDGERPSLPAAPLEAPGSPTEVASAGFGVCLLWIL